MQNFTELFLLFIIYSFLGWVLETAFASIKQRKIVNRGFLSGFLCPIYGFSAILIIRASMWVNAYFKGYYSSILVSVLFSVIIVTALEYVTGFILETLFDCKWWDYSDNYANLHGYICVKYSLLWGIAAFLLVNVEHPLISGILRDIPMRIKGYFALFTFLYFILDTIKSVIEALELMDVILNSSKYTIKKYYERIMKYERFFMACPRLIKLIINRDIRSVLNDKINKIKVQLRNKFEE